MTWSAQARWVREEGTVDLAVLREPAWYVSHPRYPLLLPVAQAAMLEVFAVDEDRHAYRALYAAFLPAFLLILWDGAARWAGRRAAAGAVLAAASLPLLTFWRNGGAAGSYSDLPLACFYGAGLLLLLRSRRGADGAAAGLLLAAAALTKNEGAPLALIAILAVFLAGRRAEASSAPTRTIRLRAVLAAAPLLVAGLALLAAWRRAIPDRYDESYARLLAASHLIAGILRLPRLIPVLAGQMLAFSQWGLFWIAAPSILWLGRSGFAGRRRGLARSLALAAAAPAALALGAYAVHWDPAPLAAVTWNRLLLQGALPLFLLFALGLRPLLGARGNLKPGAQLALEESHST